MSGASPGRIARADARGRGGAEPRAHVAELVPGDLRTRRTRSGSGERFKVSVIDRLALTDAVGGAAAGGRYRRDVADEHDAPGYESFRAEMTTGCRDPWRCAAGAVGRSALASARLIDECYSRVSLMPSPAFTKVSSMRPLEGWSRQPFELSRRCQGPAGARRVLVTGASGFIGCRTAEISRFGKAGRAGAGAHPAHASRIARLPVELVQATSTTSRQWRRSSGCEAVVHCAIGTQYGQRHRIFEVTVGGTRNLGRRGAGVRRASPGAPQHHGGVWHGRLRRARRGVAGQPAARRRLLGKQARADSCFDAHRPRPRRRHAAPGNVYGPFSRTFTTGRCST